MSVFFKKIRNAAIVLLVFCVTFAGQPLTVWNVSLPIGVNDASAAASVKQGTFTKNTATGSQTVSGLGFQPKAIIFTWTKQTATGFATNDRMGMGFATGSSNQAVISIAGDDNVDKSNFGRRRSVTNVITILSNGTPALASQASFTAFTSDGFTINWTTNDGEADIISYYAVGGADVTNAKAGTFSLTTGTGALAVTGVGFQPEFVMLLASGSEAANTNTTGKLFNMGFATGSSNQAAISTCGRDGRNNAPHSMSQQRTDQVIMGMTTTCAQDWLASFTSFGADGFTINKSDAPASATTVAYLALRGGQYNVGSFNQATVTGSQAVTSLGFQPSGLMLVSDNRIAGTTIAANSEISIGAANGSSSRGAIWAESQDVNFTDANVTLVTNKVIRMATGSATTNAEADLVSFDPGGFTLDWSTADGTTRQILYWALGGVTTTIGNGTDPSNASLAPGGSATVLDTFTFQTSSGTDVITNVTLSLASGTSAGLSLIEITNDAGSTVYGSVSDPLNDMVIITTSSLTATTSWTQYKVRITPKTHTAMPPPPGATHAVTATVSNWSGTNVHSGSDAGSATVTIDNASPADPTSVDGTVANGQVDFTWAKPTDPDFAAILVLRNTVAVTDAPTEGTTPAVDDTIGTSTVRYADSGTSFTDTGLTNGVAYSYKFFSSDSNGNYSVGTDAGPFTMTVSLTVGTALSQIPSLAIPSSNNSLRAALTFIHSSETSNITSVVITEIGTVNAQTSLANVRSYYKEQSGCSGVLPDDAIAFNATPASFDGTQKVTLTGMMPVTTTRTCLYLVVDVAAGASNGQTIELQITNPSTDVTSSVGAVSPATTIALANTTTLTTSQGTAATTLSLQVADPSKNPTVFTLSGGAIMLQEGSNPAVAITSSSVIVTNLTFTRLAYPGTPGLIRISMTLKPSSSSTAQEYVYEKTYVGSATPR